MDWDKLRVFQAAADAGSFTHAGETLGLSQSAISRQVGALEADLGAPLFHRHARGLILTEQGEMLLGAVRDVVLKLDAVRSRLIDSREKPHGELRVTTTLGPRRQLAGSAARRVRRSLPRDQAAIAVVGRRPRPRDARSGRRAQAARAKPAGPDSAPPVHRAFPRLRLSRLSEKAPATSQGRGSRSTPSGRVRSAHRNSSPVRSQLAFEPRARRQVPAHAADHGQQPSGDDACGRAWGRDRCTARLLRAAATRASCASCRKRTCRRWTASSSIPRS